MNRFVDQTQYKPGIINLSINKTEPANKLFLVDMSDLEGLLRVASFMGLGRGLLGRSYLHQRLQQQGGGAETESG